MRGISESGIASLVYLNLSSCNFNNLGHGLRFALWSLSSAATSGTLQLLVSLCLENNDINDTDGVGIVKMLPHMPRLQTLDLTNNNISNATARSLARAASSGVLPSITNLLLRHNYITCVGARYLNRSLLNGCMPGLMVLTIAENHILYIGMVHLYATQHALVLRGHVLHID